MKKLLSFLIALGACSVLMAPLKALRTKQSASRHPAAQPPKGLGLKYRVMKRINLMGVAPQVEEWKIERETGKIIEITRCTFLSVGTLVLK
jgi:hypothetical protein